MQVNSIFRNMGGNNIFALSRVSHNLKNIAALKKTNFDRVDINSKLAKTRADLNARLIETESGITETVAGEGNRIKSSNDPDQGSLTRLTKDSVYYNGKWHVKPSDGDLYGTASRPPKWDAASILYIAGEQMQDERGLLEEMQKNYPHLAGLSPEDVALAKAVGTMRQRFDDWWSGAAQKVTESSSYRQALKDIEEGKNLKYTSKGTAFYEGRAGMFGFIIINGQLGIRLSTGKGGYFMMDFNRGD